MLWDTTKYWLIINCRRFGGVCCLHLQGIPRKSKLRGRNGCKYFFSQLTFPTKAKLKMGAVSSSEASEAISQHGVISHRTLISCKIIYISIHIYFCRRQIPQNCRIAYTFWSVPVKQSTGATTKDATFLKLRCDVEVILIPPFALYFNPTTYKLFERILWSSRMWRQDCQTTRVSVYRHSVTVYKTFSRFVNRIPGASFLPRRKL